MKPINNKTVLWLRRLQKLAYFLILFVLLLVGGLLALSSLKIPNGIRLFTVKSGSMSPALSVGSIVAVRPQSDYQTKDIITFKRAEDLNIDNPAITTTHRIVDITNKENNVYYTTKGDANNAPDGVMINKQLVLGKVFFSIPFIGYPIDLAKKPVGFVFLVIIPAVVIIYDEILVIKREIVNLIQKRAQKTK